MKYKLRIGGTNDFVSKINATDPRCIPMGSVDTVHGWNHPHIKLFKSERSARIAGHMVMDIEGFHTSVEEHRP
jgi:hypothetical protein